MSKESTNLEVLSTRSGFNTAVRHMNKTLEISGDLGSNNLGDLLYERGDENLSGERGALLLRMLLIDKLGYKSVSVNLESVASNLPDLASEFSKWKGVDIVAAYHHPDLGLLIANPKVAEELANFGMLRKRELLVLYVGKGGSPADEACLKAAELAVKFFEGKKAKAPPELLKGGFTVKKLKKSEEEAAPAKGASAAKVPAKGKKAVAGRGRKAGPAKAAKAAPAAPPALRRLWLLPPLLRFQRAR